MAPVARTLPAAAAVTMLTLLLIVGKEARRADAYTVLFLPLDERFTTRFAGLNLGRVTPFDVITPPMGIISDIRTPAPLPALDAWMEAALPTADAAVISLELYVYGGLIASRISNDTTEFVAARLNRLVSLLAANSHVRVHLATVVMRIPSYSYSPPIEDPWYWCCYGAQLFQYSYYMDAYNVTGNATDLVLAQQAASQVPADIVADFVWRRARNFNVTSQLLDLLLNSTVAGAPLAQTLYITQDDNAEYGFNIAEAAAYKAFVAAHAAALGPLVSIYPGADEVGLTMLSRLTVGVMADVDARRGVPPTAPPLQLVFRDPSNSSLYLIPNYEGQPMVYTLMDQIAAAGGVPVPNNWTATAGYSARRAAHVLHHRPAAILASTGGSGSGRPNVTLLVNNFNDTPQIEAPNQPPGRSPSDYAMFTPWLCGTGAATAGVAGFLDNRYSNGADTVLVQYLAQLAATPTCATANATNYPRGLSLDRTAYAGWNTDGNTLGDAIANAVVLHYFGAYGPWGGGSSDLLRRELDALAAAQRAAAATRATTHRHSAPRRRRLNPLPSPTPVSPAADPVAPCRASCANTYRQVLRLVEDSGWQATFRQFQAAYIAQVEGENDYTLGWDLTFYEHFAWKVLATDALASATAFQLPWNLTTVYYPWNRTFEVGLFANATPAAILPLHHGNNYK